MSILNPDSLCNSSALPTDLPTLDLKAKFKELLAWANRGDTLDFTIENIQLEVAEELQEKLSSEGFRTRFNWNALDQVAAFKMPKQIHEVPGSWLSYETPFINQRIGELAECGKPSVVWKGSGDVRLGDDGEGLPTGKTLWKTAAKLVYEKTPSKYQLDGSFFLQYYDHSLGRVSNVGTVPRVVLETCHSQNEIACLHRGCNFLWNSPGHNTHAFICCRTSYPVTKALDFRAEISVWTRAPREDDPNVYYPVDPCRVGHNEEHRALSHLHKEDTASIASSQQSDMNPAAKDHFHTHGRDPNGELKIWNRTGWKLVVDETNPNAQSDKELVLNFYDFVRICDSDQARFLPAKEQEIKLDLQWLRDQFLAELDVARGKIQDVKFNDAKDREYPERFRLPRVIKTFLGDKLGIGKGKPDSKSKSLMPPS